MATPRVTQNPVGGRLPRAAAVADVLKRPLPPGALGQLERLAGQTPGAAKVIYLSTPITTGPRYLAWRRANRSISGGPSSSTDLRLRAEVISKNINAIAPLRRRIRAAFPDAHVIDPTELDRPEWDQTDYHRYWLEVIERFADVVVFAHGWEYSTGCTLEFSAALERDLPIYDDDVKPIDLRVIRSRLMQAEWELRDAGLDPKAIIAAAETVAGVLADSPAKMVAPELKDDRLYQASRWTNVAQFASFDPHLRPRHVLLRGDAPATLDLASIVQTLLERSLDRRVNVRSFKVGESKGAPFVYGLETLSGVVAELRNLAGHGYYTIVNETIDVHDGGVSGVSAGGVAEFAPDATPRVVESQAAVQLPVEVAQAMLSSVYSVNIPVPQIESVRVEFSVHPNRVGTRGGHVCVWEIEDVGSFRATPATNWPNSFSRMLGDKCFGLLLADAYGANVPQTRVISRRVAPFFFGSPTGTGEWWLRTAPRQQEPGHFTTVPRWMDPYRLLSEEDPTGEWISSVLSQEAVDAEFSGATLPLADQDDLVEGVAGGGGAFMLGGARPTRLPRHVVQAVRRAVSSLSMRLGPVRIEWAFDGERCWVLQMHRAAQLRGGVISPGHADEWLDYDPDSGLEALRALLPEATARGAGVRVMRPVGVTSHVGDLLRKARIPGVFAE